MFILTWDQIEEFRSGTESYMVKFFPYFSRKLFEPKNFPDANILSIFDKYFGKFDDRDLHEVRMRQFWITKSWISCQSKHALKGH